MFKNNLSKIYNTRHDALKKLKTCTQDIAKNKFVWHYENTKENYKKENEKSNVRNENQKPQIKVIKQSENSN